MSGRFDDKIRFVTGSATSDFGARLHVVAIDFVVPTGGPRIDQAVALAEDLVASGFIGDATVEVAALRRDASRSDAEPLVRNMLAEHGIDLPTLRTRRLSTDCFSKRSASGTSPWATSTHRSYIDFPHGMCRMTLNAR